MSMRRFKDKNGNPSVGDKVGELFSATPHRDEKVQS